MEARRSTYRAAIRTATVLSAVAVLAALVLDTVTGVSQTGLVLAVIVVGFVSSLAVTERVARSTAARPNVVHLSRGHRVTVLPVSHRIA